MQLSELPVAFQQWCETNKESFDGIPVSIQLAKINRYRNGNLFAIVDLQRDNEAILHEVARQIRDGKLDGKLITIVF